MNYTLYPNQIALIEPSSKSLILTDSQSALDLFSTLYYQENCKKIILYKENIIEDFFDLKTKIAGELLQKFVNYGFSLAIVGDFSNYTSKSLQDFIYESNLGSTINFLPTLEDALRKLNQ